MACRLASIALVLGLAACGSEGRTSIFGPPTGSECPPSSTLTYDNFGRKFMEDYCTVCHHSDLTGTARMGAPSFHDFDTIFGIRAVDDHIDETTAAGPDATNRGMPPRGYPTPSDADRFKLGEWIACGTPE
jgi:cytochrome c5